MPTPAPNPTPSPFLAIPPQHHVAANPLAFAVRDKFPVSPGHTLVIPRRQIPDWWSATADEHQAILTLVDQVRADLLNDATRATTLPGTPRPDGFNVGFNAGDAAGQTVNHLHMHVIPRYRDDMDDPRGGVRHVIPEKGNYLAPPVTQTHPAHDATPLESAATHAINPTALMTWLLSIIQEGRKSATYKPALLMAILDAAIESGDAATVGSTLRIPLSDLADRVIASYWPQTRPNPLGEDGVLRQGTGRGLRIINAIVEFRTAAGCAPHTDLHAVITRNPHDYVRLQRTVARALAKQPIPRLQRPGTTDSRAGYEPWLFDDSGFIAEQGALPGIDFIELNRGVAHALAINSQILRPALESVWSAEVARYNNVNSEAQQLRDFLFGTQRTSLDPVREALLDVEGARCFYCDRILNRATTHVDHVIPWSHLPLNDLANLVLSDDRCNGDKSARLISSERLAKWCSRDQAALAPVAATIDWAHGPARTFRVADSAYRWHPHGIPVWRGLRDLVTYDAPEQERALALLGAGRPAIRAIHK